MQYVVFQGNVDAEGPVVHQEYYIRHIDGSPVKSDAERKRVIQCVEAAIERRVSEAFLEAPNTATTIFRMPIIALLMGSDGSVLSNFTSNTGNWTEKQVNPNLIWALRVKSVSHLQVEQIVKTFANANRDFLKFKWRRMKKTAKKLLF